MSKKWHSGPPPSVGWWPASLSGDFSSLRWWNGRRWSISAQKTSTPMQAAKNAAIGSLYSDLVMWRDRPKYWPARSRT